MKKLTILFLLISFSARAQYNVGQYVTDTLYDGVYSSIAFCTPNPDVTLTVDSSLFENVSGLNYHFIVTGVSAPGIGSPSTGPFAVGDTLPLSPGVGHPVFFPNGGTLNYILQAYGTPLVANEVYYCDIGFLFTLGFCDNLAVFHPDSLGPQCLVGTVGSVEPEAATVTFYPNPATDQIILDGTSEGSSYLISDLSGRTVQHGIVGQRIDVSDLPPALYTVHIISNKTSSSLRFLKLEYE